MNNIDFSQILEQVCMEEYTIKDNVPDHRFSFRHRKNMKRILDMPFSCPKPEKKYKLSRRTLCVLLAAIFLALLAATGSAFYIRAFMMRKHKENTQLFAFAVQGAPETIRQEYYLSGLPEGYQKVEQIYEDICIWTVYQFGDDPNNVIVFTQTVKKEYDNHFNTEGYTFEEIEINGSDGLLINWSSDDRYLNEIVWDNGDYILTVEGMLPKKEMINLAKSAEFV